MFKRMLTRLLAPVVAPMIETALAEERAARHGELMETLWRERIEVTKLLDDLGLLGSCPLANARTINDVTGPYLSVPKHPATVSPKRKTP